MNSGRYSVRVADFGGQGVISMCYVLANAFSLHHTLNALMVQSYGPAARGGSCRADAIISENSIDYPKSDSVDVLIAMSIDGYSSFNKNVKEGGIIIYDADFVEIDEKKDGISYYGISGLEVAKKIGNPLVANMVMLGATLAITGIIPLEALKLSVKDRFPRFVDLNIKALEEGVRLGEMIKR